MLNQKFYSWTSIDRSRSGSELQNKYRDLRSKGIGGVFVGGGISELEFEIIKQAGLELHCWMWTTNRGEQWIRDNHPDWFMVSRTGKSCFDNPPYVNYYRWISPVIPGVQTYLEEKVEELAKIDTVDGVHLDYVRYPDVILPKALWKDYGLVQTTELADYDFCYSDSTRKAFLEQTGRDPLEIQDPANDQEWLHFRYDSVTHLVKKLKVVTESHGKKLTAAVFPTPRIARKICRQDWDKWPLDAVCPMIYHSFYEEPTSWIGDAVRENIQAVRFPILAGLYMPAFNNPADFQEGLDFAFQNGAKGVSLFGEIGNDYWNVISQASGTY